MSPTKVYASLVDELEQLALNKAELSQLRTLNELPSLMVDQPEWDTASFEEALRVASNRIPDKGLGRKGRRRAVRLALGVERGREKSLKEAVRAMGLSSRESQPSRMKTHLTPLLSDLAIVLLEMSYEILRPSNQVEILTDDGKVAGSLIDYIGENRPKKLRFLELSAASVSGVMATAIQSLQACEIQLLVADPRMLSPFHWRTRMLPALQRLQLSCSELHDDVQRSISIEARCYGFRHPPVEVSPHPSLWPDAMPAIRGRSFDRGLLSIGWYSYAPMQSDTQASDSEEAKSYPVREVWGHHNPVILARPDDSGFAALQSFFDQQFAAIWDGRCERKIPPAGSLADAVALRDPIAFKELSNFLTLV